MIRIVLSVIFFASLVLESTVIPFPLTLITLTFISTFLKEAVSWAFMVGLLLDLFAGRILGSSSLFFLGVVLISCRYRKKLHPENFFYQLFFLILVLWLYSFIFYKYIDFWKLVAVTACWSVVLGMARKVLPKVGEEKGLVVE